jgi:RNA polymerase sigma-70 factor (ECF subfamily)
MVMAYSRQTEKMSDSDVLADVMAGDVDAFEKIVDRHKNRLFNFVCRFVGDRETAEDIVQETFLRAFRRRREYRAIANFSTWLFTIAGNLAKSELRRRKRWRFLSLNWDEETETGIDIPDESQRPDTVTETSLADHQIQEAIESLPANYRKVVLLRDVEGLSYQEIAEIVGRPVGTVKSRVNRARLRLQRRLRMEGRDVGLDV